ncbi:uncharacterized protein [Amphiura filiformis]|uniref:uncharacterized protein n=1 Tax=Amphiura filiformis TaxID=82378 RepID=UPI003B211356
MSFKSKANDEDFYSAMAADFDEDSEVSEADVSKMLADMDDMDDNLFTSSLKPRKGSSRASSRAAKTSDTSSKDSRPASRMSAATSKDASPRIPDSVPDTPDSGITGEENGLPRKGIFDSPEPSSPIPRRQSRPKSAPTNFDFGDFDEDDPLAGLLSDDDDDMPKKKAVPKKKAAPKKQEDQPIKTKAEIPTTQTEDNDNIKATNKEIVTDKPVSSPEKGSKGSGETARKKKDDIDFDDDDDILGTMGFDDETPRAEKKKVDPDAKEKQAAQAKISELFGKSSSVAEKPPVGRKREFVLDKKYVKTEPKKEEPKEEDFIFGDYKPSSVGGLGRPESAPPPRRSVRFEDSDNDDSFGTSTFTRPRSRGRMKPTLDDVPKRPHSSADTRRRTSDTDSKPSDDWLELAVGADTKKEKKTPAPKSDGAKSGEGGGKKESMVAEKKEKPAPSAADYLGLAGDDIDPDTIVTSKPPTPRGQSSMSTTSPKGQDPFTTPAKRETTSPFPWDSSENSPTKRRSSIQAETDQPSEIKGMLGDDFDDDDDDDNQPLQTSLMAQQLAQLQKMQEQEVNVATTAPASRQKQDQPQVTQAQPASHADTRIIQPHELGMKQQQQISSVPQTPPPSAPSSTPTNTSRPEPKWRQELRQRQQQQEQSSASSPAPQQTTPAQSNLNSTQGQQPGFGPDNAPASRTTDMSRTMGTSGALGMSGTVGMSGTMGTSGDMMRQMQMRQQELDAAMQRQQEQWLAQQQEQMRQMQENQQKAMQQQMEQQMQQQQMQQQQQMEQQMQQQQMQQQQMQQQQMQQQQMMMNSNKAPNSSPYSTLPFSVASTSMPSMGSLSLEAKIQQLEMEKKLVEMQLETMQQKHQQQLNAVEGAHKDFVQLLEESSKRRESRLRQESELLGEQYESRLQQVTTDQTRLEQTYQHRLQSVTQDHSQQIERIQQGHRQAIDILQQQHQEELQQVQQSLKQELENVTNTQSHSRSLQAVVDQVQATSRELGSLQNRVHGQHQTHIDERMNELRQKDEQLKVLEKRLNQQQEETISERTRLEGLINRLEAHIQQQNTQLDEERWRLRQEQNKLASLQKAAEEERKMTAQQMTTQQATLQQAKDAVLTEQKSIMAQCLEERKSLAMERSQVAATRRELEVTLQQQADKALQIQAEQEGKLESLASERSQLSTQMTSMKQQQQSLEEEKQKLREQQELVDTEKRRLQQLAETLRKKSQQIQDTIHEAVTTRNEGEIALDRAKKTEAEHNNRLRNIQHQIQILRATEKHIAQERVDLAQEQRKLEKLRQSIRCKRCGVNVSTAHASAPSSTTLPITSPAHVTFSSPQIQSTPKAASRGDSRRGYREVIAKVEMDTSIHMWKAAAEKDKEFLEEESAYLEALRSPMPPSMRVQ